MPFYKIFFLLIAFSSFIINANEENSIIDEYRVEIVIFKFKEVSTSENFVEELTIPSKSVITLVEPKLYLNETALNSFPKNDSFFQNLLKNLKPINNNSSENFDMLKNHWDSFFLSTNAFDLHPLPFITCSFASTVFSTGSQLT